MNHRTHSGNSPTVITNPNAFDSSNSIGAAAATTKATSTKNNRQHRLNAPKSAISSSDHSSGNNKNQTAIDFDALESIPFDEVTITTPTTTNTAIPAKFDDTHSDIVVTNHDSNAHISAVFKKLTTYFSHSSHKTLTNLKSNNHKNSSKHKCNLTNKLSLSQQLDDHNNHHKFINSKQNSIENCAVIENCNAISLPPSIVSSTSNRSECRNSSKESCNSDDTSPPSDNKQIPFVTINAKKSTNNHHSSDKISVNNKINLSANATMCRADDSYALDGRNATINTSTMPSSTAQTNTTIKRTKDIKSTLDGLQTGETFSLPRVSLRQSSASPTASSGNHRKNVINSKLNGSNASLDRRRSYGEQEQVPSSHYSTEKSGSSGYYSSNVYSTSSVEDHIYSEPVIDGINDSNRRRKFDQKLDQQIGLANLEKSIKTLEKHLKCLNKPNKKDKFKHHHHHHQQQQQQQQQRSKASEQCQELTTKSNGDEQTKRLPTIVEGMDNNALALVPYRRNGDIEAQRQHNNWNANTTDDSLMDLDLDTFLLIDETARDTMKKSNFNAICGVDSNEKKPTFQQSNTEHEINTDHNDSGQDDDDDGHEHTDNDDNGDNNNHKSVTRNSDENNYKCTKYINSCPDDAYNVDEIIDYKYEQSASVHFPFLNNKKLLPFYMRNIEDQLNHQNTKEILEEIRDKLTVLLKPTSDESEHDSSTESDGIGSSKISNNSKTISLLRNITELKHDVDNYLVMMNQQNEFEIRAFCSGLSKNYKLLTMQHALNNRTRRPKLSTSDIGSEVYSNSSSSQQHQNHQALVRRRRRLKNQMKRNQGNKNQMRTLKNQSKILLNHLENESIRCSSSSDSNFQLQRRHSDSICSSWDEGQQILTTSSSGRGSSNSAHSDNSIGNDVIIPIEVETLLSTSNCDTTARIITPLSSSNETSDLNTSIESDTVATITSQPPVPSTINGHIESNLAMQQPSLITVDNAKDASNDDKDIMLEWHRNKPSIWQQYYGSKRLKYSNMVKKIKGKLDVNTTAAVMSYPSTRPETDFTLDVPRAEQLRIKMQQEKKFRCRCRFMLAFFSLAFFLLTVVIFSLMLSRGKRMFGSMTMP
ncbi:probable serine/threonine-protein kinase DDB_G0282963 isoform X2 [Contarinia nasturtii]|uniref:probable serine/threonine-protein kinase DDB_G0282963 isoform X2 n=1 Tax=Contarinia nasturtii TaxID=265458 RepID=UPI0012D4005D|nr:probable serine/threonine-protein kinase DDB_G0282963 isoform X2 [Contarinia nasturtii]